MEKDINSKSMLFIVVPYYNLLLYSCENYFSLSQDILKLWHK